MVTSLPPLKIVYATNWFNTPKFGQDLNIGLECPVPEGFAIDFNNTISDTWCTLTSNTEDIANAAGLIFHAPDTVISDLPKHVRNQPWTLESLESPYSSPFRAESSSMRNFQYLASYSFKSSFFFSYFSPSIMDAVNRPLPKDFIKTKTKAAPILWIAKNCGATNGREKYIRKLMDHINVHSYGECLNNMPFPETKSRTDLISEYKFYLGVENSNCEDYVTEKVHDTLALSAVPIVDGPTSYEGYIPTKRSVIYMDAYPDPKDLADYIMYLDRNDTAYLEYLSFRRDAINIAPKDRLEPSFISNWSDTLAHNERSSYCSVCRGMIPWWAYKSDPDQKGTYQDPHQKDIFLVDQSCSLFGKWTYAEQGPPYHPNWTPRPRDEFTRFNVTESSSTVGNHTPATVNARIVDPVDKSISVLIANASFEMFFIILLVLLYRESRKHKHNQVQPPPV